MELIVTLAVKFLDVDSINWLTIILGFIINLFDKNNLKNTHSHLKNIR